MSATTITKLKIATATASGNDGNLPTNVLDGDLNTRWACQGNGSWIQLDLGSDQAVNQIGIAWYKGDQRKYTFSINFRAASGADVPTAVMNLVSSGTTLQPEKYTSTTQTIACRYVIITVNGNTTNNWAAMTEAELYGPSTTTPTTPPPVQPPTPPVTTTGTDKFGLKMLYPTKANGQTWFLDISTLAAKTDSRVITEIPTTSLSKDTANGSIKVTRTSDVENRFYITTVSGYNHSKCSQSWSTNAGRGYMQNPDDWRNVEITAQVRINSVFTVSGHSLVWYARSGRHGTDKTCEGSSYKGNIGYNLKSRFQKESGHPNYNTTNWKDLPAGSTLAFGKWFGYKFACYDIENGAAVKLEIWIDAAMNNNWVKVSEITDRTGWGTTNACGATDARFMWGAPLATYRFDSAKDIDFAKMSVREISV